MSITEATDHLTATVERQRKDIESLRKLLSLSIKREEEIEHTLVNTRSEVRRLQLELAAAEHTRNEAVADAVADKEAQIRALKADNEVLVSSINNLNSQVNGTMEGEE